MADAITFSPDAGHEANGLSPAPARAWRGPRRGQPWRAGSLLSIQAVLAGSATQRARALSSAWARSSLRESKRHVTTDHPSRPRCRGSPKHTGPHACPRRIPPTGPGSPTLRVLCPPLNAQLEGRGESAREGFPWAPRAEERPVSRPAGRTPVKSGLNRVNSFSSQPRVLRACHTKAHGAPPRGRLGLHGSCLAAASSLVSHTE